MRARRPYAALAALAVVTACGGGVRRNDVADPSSLVVAPAPALRSSVPVPVPAPAPALVAPIEVAVNMQRLCVRIRGRVHCTTSVAADVALTATPPLEGIDDAVSLALSASFGCAATHAGNVLCFGDNTYGQLGAKLRADRSQTPVVVSGVTAATRVFTSDSEACAVLRDQTVRCWGRNDAGQTGGSTYYGPPARELVDADNVEGVRDVASLAVGGWTTCASSRDRGVTCWGRAPFAADRMMRAAQNLRPVPIPELAGIDEVSASGGAFCGISASEVKCWGELYSLLAGDATRSSNLASTGVTGARKVRVGSTHACALLSDGSVSCWGQGSYGALGRGETTGDATLAPETVRGVGAVVEIAVGGTTSCAVTRTDEIYCWGSWPDAGRAARKETVPIKMRVD